MKNRKSFIQTLLNLTGHAKSVFMYKLKHNGKADILREKKVQAALQDAGNARRKEMHRRSCITAYQAKKQLVEAGKGNHCFIHEFTSLTA